MQMSSRGTSESIESIIRSFRQLVGGMGLQCIGSGGTGAQVLKTTEVRASQLPTVRWHGGGDHRDTQQVKTRIEDIFQ